MQRKQISQRTLSPQRERGSSVALFSTAFTALQPTSVSLRHVLLTPREGEKDNTAWSSARSAARTGIDKWVKLVWAGRSFLTRDALSGYAPDPDWKKLPAFNELVKAAFGSHGVIQDTTHPIYRELMGAPTTINDDDADL